MGRRKNKVEAVEPAVEAVELIPFDEHQAWCNDQAEMFPRKNGLGCKQCGEELLDLSAAVIGATPPLRRVQCENGKCRWAGHRLVIG